MEPWSLEEPGPLAALFTEHEACTAASSPGVGLGTEGRVTLPLAKFSPFSFSGCNQPTVQCSSIPTLLLATCFHG